MGQGSGATRVICPAGHTLAEVEWQWAPVPIESVAPYLDDLGIDIQGASRSVDLCLGRVHLHTANPGRTLALLEDFKAASVPASREGRNRISLPWPVDYQSQPAGMLRRLPLECDCGHGAIQAWLSTRELYRRVVDGQDKVMIRYHAETDIVKAGSSDLTTFGTTRPK
jgi:hypothetical protein